MWDIFLTYIKTFSEVFMPGAECSPIICFLTGYSKTPVAKISRWWGYILQRGSLFIYSCKPTPVLCSPFRIEANSIEIAEHLNEILKCLWNVPHVYFAVKFPC